MPLLVLTLVTQFALIEWGAPLQTAAAPHGIISMELAGDPLAMRLILQGWGAEAKARAAFSLGLDFLFLVLYSTTLALACVWASEQTSSRALAITGIGIAWAQWVAGLLDAGENTALLFVLFVSAASPWPELARLCAIPKFLLVGVGLLYSVLGVVLNRCGPAARARHTGPL